MTPSSNSRGACTGCGLFPLGSSQLILNVSGLDLSKQEVTEIVQREQEKAATAIGEALTELSDINHKRRLLAKYESQLSSWYANERRYIKEHSPVIMSSLMTSENPVASAISKTRELYLALHPKPSQPFLDMEEARREVDQYYSRRKDLGVEVLREVEDEIRNQPERTAWLVGAKDLKERLAAVAGSEGLPVGAGDSFDAAKVAAFAAKSPLEDLRESRDDMSPFGSPSVTIGGTPTPASDFDPAKTGNAPPEGGESARTPMTADYSPSASDNK